MNKPSHILMGKYLYRYVKKHYNIQLDRKNFILGNVLPDYCPSFLTRPHFLKNSAKYTQNIISSLMSKGTCTVEGKKISRRLGVLCHFFTDFFCYAHRDHTVMSLTEHIAYEKQLFSYFFDHFKQIGSLSFDVPPDLDAQESDLYRNFKQLHASYLLSHPSFGNDITYAITACIGAIVTVSRHAQSQTDYGDLYILSNRQSVSF